MAREKVVPKSRRTSHWCRACIPRTSVLHSKEDWKLEIGSDDGGCVPPAQKHDCVVRSRPVPHIKTQANRNVTCSANAPAVIWAAHPCGNAQWISPLNKTSLPKYWLHGYSEHASVQEQFDKFMNQQLKFNGEWNCVCGDTAIPRTCRSRPRQPSSAWALFRPACFPYPATSPLLCAHVQGDVFALCVQPCHLSSCYWYNAPPTPTSLASVMRIISPSGQGTPRESMEEIFFFNSWNHSSPLEVHRHGLLFSTKSLRGAHE